METPPPDSPYLSNHYDIFISHCGDDSKAKVALPLRARLMQCNLTVFVDEMDLPVGGDAEHNMQQALKLCKVCLGLLHLASSEIRIFALMHTPLSSANVPQHWPGS